MQDNSPKCEKCGEMAMIRLEMKVGDETIYVCPECKEGGSKWPCDTCKVHCDYRTSKGLCPHVIAFKGDKQ